MTDADRPPTGRTDHATNVCIDVDVINVCTDVDVINVCTDVDVINVCTDEEESQAFYEDDPRREFVASPR